MNPSFIAYLDVCPTGPRVRVYGPQGVAVEDMHGAPARALLAHCRKLKVPIYPGPWLENVPRWTQTALPFPTRLDNEGNNYFKPRNHSGNRQPPEIKV